MRYLWHFLQYFLFKYSQLLHYDIKKEVIWILASRKIMLKRSNPNFIARFWGQIPSPSFHYLLQFVTLKGMIVFRHDVYNFWKYKLFFYILSFFYHRIATKIINQGGGGLFVLLPLIFNLRNTPTINPNGPQTYLKLQEGLFV